MRPIYKQRELTISAPDPSPGQPANPTHRHVAKPSRSRRSVHHSPRSDYSAIEVFLAGGFVGDEGVESGAKRAR